MAIEVPGPRQAAVLVPLFVDGAGAAHAAFFMRATPIGQVRDVAAAGESMPPKSTFFFPKVPTGMVFNLLED